MSRIDGQVRGATTRIRILCADTDMMGVVYYAGYLRFFEAGRVDLLRMAGMAYPDIEALFGVRLPVVEIQARYSRPAGYDDELTLNTTIGAVGAASVRFDYRIERGAALIASGHTTHAAIDGRGKPRRLPSELAHRLHPFLLPQVHPRACGRPSAGIRGPQ